MSADQARCGNFEEEITCQFRFAQFGQTVRSCWWRFRVGPVHVIILTPTPVLGTGYTLGGTLIGSDHMFCALFHIHLRFRTPVCLIECLRLSLFHSSVCLINGRVSDRMSDERAFHEPPRVERLSSHFGTRLQVRQPVSKRGNHITSRSPKELQNAELLGRFNIFISVHCGCRSRTCDGDIKVDKIGTHVIRPTWPRMVTTSDQTSA